MAGSDFSEATKEQARRLAFFRCCYCHERPGDDVHHLVPKEEGGLGELDNAILLCVQCHADYGHRTEKRAQLRQARDHWYEIVERRYTPVALHRVWKYLCGECQHDWQPHAPTEARPSPPRQRVAA